MPSPVHTVLKGGVGVPSPVHTRCSVLVPVGRADGFVACLSSPSNSNSKDFIVHKTLH